MNEGKQRLQAMRKMLKKKANNNQNALNNNFNDAQQNGQTEVQTSNHKIPIQGKIQKVEQTIPNNNNLSEKVLSNQQKKQQEKVSQLGLSAIKNKSLQQDLQQGEIQDEEQKKQEQQKQPNDYSKLQSNQAKILSFQKQIHEDTQKVISSSEKNDKMIEEEKSAENQKYQNQVQQKVEKSNPQNLIENEQKLEKVQLNSSIVINQNDLFSSQKFQHQPKKDHLNDSIQATQRLNLQFSQSHHNNSDQISQNRTHQHTPSNKSAIKIVLKQLQMIKSTIHNLNVTYRGVQYLRERIKQDAVLKRKIKQRLMDLGEDDGMDVLRKLVKKIQSQPLNTTQNQRVTSLKDTRINSAALIEPSFANQQQITEKNLSQPEVLLSNEAIDY